MVSWQPPPLIDYNGPLIGHVIQYSRVGSSDTFSVNVTSGNTYIITGVVAFVSYSIRVAAINDNGTGPSSNPVMQMSGEDGKFYTSKLPFHNSFLLCHLYVPLIKL